MFISFGWTWPALGNGKVVTRRYWKASHAAKFKAGVIVDAWDKVPYANGKKIGEIRIIQDAFQQNTTMMDYADYVDEGFEFLANNLSKIPVCASSPIHKILLENKSSVPMETFFWNWKKKNDLVWVVKFEVLKLL